MARSNDKSIFKRYPIAVVSPSQLVDYLDCPRKWALRRVFQIKPPDDAKKFLFGNAMHAVLQRWLEADDTGRGPDGKEVDLYPERVETTDDDGNVTVSKWNEGLTRKESQLVQMLVERLTGAGIVRRLPGRLIEVEAEYELTPGVGITMFLDVASPEGVEDHKSTKDRKWASTATDLAKDPKMLAYAKAWFDNYDGDTCTMRLNYATKNDKAPEVWPVSVAVDREGTEKFWNETIVKAAEGMKALKLAYKAGKLTMDDWRQITGPIAKDACQKYGGCTFARICGRMTSPARLKAELDQLRDNKKPEPTTQEKKPMSIFGKKSKPAPAPVVEDDNDPVTATAVEAEEAVEEAQDLPPWHSPGCMACKDHPGLNSKGEPCKACDHKSAREGRPTSGQFTWGLDAEGNLWWKAKEAAQAPAGAPKGVSGQAQVVPPVKTPQKAAQAVKTVTPKVVAAPAPTVQKTIDEQGNVVDADTGEVLEAAQQPEKRGRGRPKGSKNKAPQAAQAPAQAPADETSESQEAPAREPVSNESPVSGFDLFINCIPQGADYVDLAQVMHHEGAELAAALGAENYYMVDAFKRRDFLASKAASVAKELDGQSVIAVGGGQDLKVYLEALRPYARSVTIGVF